MLSYEHSTCTLFSLDGYHIRKTICACMSGNKFYKTKTGKYLDNGRVTSAKTAVIGFSG